MYEVNNSFKEKMKIYGKLLNFQIEFGTIVIDKPYVKKFEKSFNGDILTSVMNTIILEISKYKNIDSVLTVDNVNEMTVEEINETLVKYFSLEEDISKSKSVRIRLGVKTSENEEYEYVNYGEFRVYEVEDKVETDSLKFTLCDLMIDTHIPYDLNLVFPMTVSEFLQAICSRFEFTLLTPEFANSTNIITEDKYAGLNKTFRDILDEIAEVSGGFIKIFNKDLSVCYPTDTGETIDEQDLEQLHIGEYVGKYNSVVLGRSPQEDNIYFPSDIPNEQRKSIRIDNNQIMDKDRELYIQNIYDKVNNFEYYVFDAVSFGFGYFEFGDIVTLKDLESNNYKTILMNNTQNIETGYKEKLYTEKTEYSETKYENATGIEKRVTNTEIQTNKQQNEIKAIIEQQSQDGTKINSLEMDLSSTELRIEQVDNDKNEQIESLRQDITGLTNTVINSGGQNIFLYSAENYDGNIQEYSDTEIINNSVSGLAYNLEIGTATQTVHIKNGVYTISFLYKKLIALAECKVKINDTEYVLDSMNFTSFEKTVNVTSNIIEIQFITDTDSSCYVVDLMGNIGATKITWSQNANETITDTVKIGKGIQVDSSKNNTYHRIDADGNRTYNKATNQVVSELTDKGLEAEEIVSRGNAQLSGMLVQKIEGQVWLSSLL